MGLERLVILRLASKREPSWQINGKSITVGAAANSKRPKENGANTVGGSP